MSAHADEWSGQSDRARETASSRDGGNDGHLASLGSSTAYEGHIPPATRRWMKHKATVRAVQVRYYRQRLPFPISSLTPCKATGGFQPRS